MCSVDVALTATPPAWWDGAVTVRLGIVNTATDPFDRSALTWLPGGVSLQTATGGSYWPWSQITYVGKVT